MIKNKKGQMQMLWLFVIFAGIIVLGIVFAIVLGLLHWGSNIITPIAESVGEVGGANVSQIGQQTVGVLDTVIGILPMLVAFAYLMCLVGCIVLVLSYRTTQNPLFIGLYLALMILVIFVAILGSNAYQDMYNGTDEMALELQNMTVLSFLILRAPFIFAVVGFISGIFLFAGKQGESSGGYSYGGTP